MSNAFLQGRKMISNPHSTQPLYLSSQSTISLMSDLQNLTDFTSHTPISQEAAEVHVCLPK